MTIEKKVMWIEGMFLRQHHFQQQDLRTESLIRYIGSAIQPYFWGFSEVKFDNSKLLAGQFGVETCEGLFPDGLPFSFPDEAADLAAIEVDASVRDAAVYLAVPSTSAAKALADRPKDDDTTVTTRFSVDVKDVSDALNPGGASEKLSLGRPALRFLIGDEARRSYSAMQIAKIQEVTADRKVVLDEDFIPPILMAGASEALSRKLQEIVALFEARALRFAENTRDFSTAGGNASNHLSLLQICNRWAARLHHIVARRPGEISALQGGRGRALIHPAQLHLDLVEAAAELAAFTNDETFRPPEFLAYDHDRLDEVLSPVFAELRRSLSHLIVNKSEEIPLKYGSDFNIYYSQDVTQELLSSARLILVATSDLLEEEFRSSFPARTNVGSLGEMPDIMKATDRSVPLTSLSHFPDGLKPINGWVAFSMDTNHPDWTGVKTERTIGIQVQDMFPGLKVRLWAIRD